MAERPAGRPACDQFGCQWLEALAALKAARGVCVSQLIEIVSGPIINKR